MTARTMNAGVLRYAAFCCKNRVMRTMASGRAHKNNSGNPNNNGTNNKAITGKVRIDDSRCPLNNKPPSSAHQMMDH